MKRITIFVITFCALTGCPCGPGENGVVYFLVATPNSPAGDSYVLPLANADDVAHARSIIEDPDGTTGHIVVAHIAAGSGNPPNRDVQGSGCAWSWHVSEFVEFAEMTIEILDGNPSLVQEDVDGWIESTNGMIGFWSYTVVREVSSCELRRPHLCDLLRSWS